MPSRGTFTVWRSRLTGTSYISTRKKCKVLYLGRNNPCHQHTLGEIKLKRSLTEKVLGVLADTKLNMSYKYALDTKKAIGMLDCIRQSIANR